MKLSNFYTIVKLNPIYLELDPIDGIGLTYQRNSPNIAGVTLNQKQLYFAYAG